MENVETELKWETKSLVWQKPMLLGRQVTKDQIANQIFTNSDLNLDPSVARKIKYIFSFLASTWNNLCTKKDPFES